MKEKTPSKRELIKAEKEMVRGNIELMRSTVHSFLTTKQTIPRHIVDGSHSEIVAFKDACENAVALYHVQNKPGDTLTLPALKRVQTRLSQLTAKLGIKVAA